MAKTKLTKQEVDQLVTLHTNAKLASEALSAAKAKICGNLLSGTYLIEGIGKVLKTVTSRKSTNYDRLLADNPQIDIDRYAEYKDVESVNITNLRPAKKSIFG